jgi:type II secretory pathway predicted ATPase ExeA
MRDARVDFTLASTGNRSPFLTYEPYYGLKEKAFSLSADPRFLFKSRTHALTFDALRAGIRRREGIIVLTGEPGTGKTTLCRSVVAGLDRKTFCAFVPDPFVSREDLLRMLLIEFGVVSVDDVKSGRLREATRPELSYPLCDFLKSLVPLQAYAVMVIDEAQNLSSQLLEEIRILADLEGPEKLLQLVLVGQPELRDKLKDPTMRQVDQRVSVRCSLEPLERDGLEGYIAHRLTIAGGGSDRVEFTPEALDTVFHASNGNPRVTNLIVDKSLNRGHLDRTWIITPGIVTAALGDLGYAMPTPDLTLDMFPEETAAPPLQAPMLPDLPDINDDSPQVMPEPSTPVVPATPTEHGGRRRLLRAALLVAVGFAVTGTGLALNEWAMQRQELAQPVLLPAVSAPARPPLSAGPAPVIPPAEFFAPVLP